MLSLPVASASKPALIGRLKGQSHLPLAYSNRFRGRARWERKLFSTASTHRVIRTDETFRSLLRLPPALKSLCDGYSAFRELEGVK